MTCPGCWKCCIVNCQNGKDTDQTYSFAKCCRTSVVQFCKWIPVWILWIIIGWSYYVYVYLLCIDTVADTVERVIYLVVYHIFLIMMMWSAMRTVLTNVHVIPNEFYLTDDQVTELRNEVKWTKRKTFLESLASVHEFQTITKDGGEEGSQDVRYCDKCKCLKPDRCHHCSICGSCVLKMDHHCPWTNNCVGLYNYKYFLLMVSYAVLMSTFVAATLVRFTVQIFEAGDRPARITYIHASLLILQFVSILFVVVNLSLLIYHLCLICRNVTTLETFFPPTFRAGPDSSFNWGCSYNFKQIFGENVLLWFVPVYTSLGDGVKFPITSSVEDGSVNNDSDLKQITTDTVTEPR